MRLLKRRIDIDDDAEGPAVLLADRDAPPCGRGGRRCAPVLFDPSFVVLRLGAVQGDDVRAAILAFKRSGVFKARGTESVPMFAFYAA
ncbi:MAG TPA: hypothetical protein DDZ68_13675 [Parvularcula sp.]|nr:hypothetical protein [Parvularcula sp.]HBS30632.1 hypothetical protein [Parvularcula sp.]